MCQNFTYLHPVNTEQLYYVLYVLQGRPGLDDLVTRYISRTWIKVIFDNLELWFYGYKSLQFPPKLKTRA